jgi:hypothetical protein
VFVPHSQDKQSGETTETSRKEDSIHADSEGFPNNKGAQDKQSGETTETSRKKDSIHVVIS